MNAFTRVGTWWSLAQQAAGRLARPPIDAAAMDRDVERIVRWSRLGRAAAGASAVFGRAWGDSLARRLARRFLHHWTVFGKAQRLRQAGWSAAVAGTVALVVQALKPVPDGPLSWVLPLGIGVAGLLLAAAAVPAARRLPPDQDL